MVGMGRYFQVYECFLQYISSYILNIEILITSTILLHLLQRFLPIKHVRTRDHFQHLKQRIMWARSVHILSPRNTIKNILSTSLMRYSCIFHISERQKYFQVCSQDLFLNCKRSCCKSLNGMF